jgi:hypothetical protein
MGCLVDEQHNGDSLAVFCDEGFFLDESGEFMGNRRHLIGPRVVQIPYSGTETASEHGHNHSEIQGNWELTMGNTITDAFTTRSDTHWCTEGRRNLVKAHAARHDLILSLLFLAERAIKLN